MRQVPIVACAPNCDGASVPARPIALLPSSLPLAVVIFALGAAGPTGCAEETIDPTTPAWLAVLDGEPCPEDASFTCGFVTVPLDHAHPEDGRTLDLAVAVRPADGASLGLLVLIDGGPGYAGIDGTDSLLWLEPELSARFDLLYFDLRGVSRSAGIDCVAASDAWYGRGFHVASEAERDEVSARARVFSQACPDETGWSEVDLALLNTAQAAEDLEAVRVALGDGPITVYGLSYGTQLAQTYVAAHPEAVRAVVLDGALDLTRPMLDYDLGVVRAVNDNLARSFAWCAADAACAVDLPDATAGYETLLAQLDGGPIELSFPLPDGTALARTFAAVDLDHLATLTMDDEPGRGAFLRALADARRGDVVPLRRLLDHYDGIDPRTGATADDGFSDAIYYAFTCNDYGKVAQSSYLQACAEATLGEWSSEGCYGDLPCASWPTAKRNVARPAPFAPTGIPVLVINADADIATPVEQGQSLVASLAAQQQMVHELAVIGGHHVMYGSDDCVNASTSGFLLDPSSLTGDVTCDVGLVFGYAQLSPDDASGYAQASAFASSLTTELFALPFFPYDVEWSCDVSGGVSVDADEVTLSGCSFVSNLTVDGSGSWDATSGALTLSVMVSGSHQGMLEISFDGSETTVSGTWDGAPAD